MQPAALEMGNVWEASGKDDGESGMAALPSASGNDF